MDFKQPKNIRTFLRTHIYGPENLAENRLAHMDGLEKLAENRREHMDQAQAHYEQEFHMTTREAMAMAANPIPGRDLGVLHEMNREILKYDHPGIIHEALTALNENAFMPQDDDDLNNRTDSPWRSMPDRILITTPAPQLDRELRKALRTGSQASIRSAYRKVAEVELVIRTVSQERPLEGLLEEIMEVRQRLSGCNVTEWIRNLQEIREQTIREQTARDQPSALTEHVMHQLEKACRDMNDFVVLDGEGARQTAKQSMRIGTSLAVIDRHIWSQTGA